MKNFLQIALIIAVASLAWGLTGCDSEQKKLDEQHHLFALQGCVAETQKADAAMKEMFAGDPHALESLTQGTHDWRAAQCMSVEEKTTIAFQQAKHDDYGKCEQCGVTR